MSDRIVGRRAEERAVADFLDTARHQPSALIIEGEAGIGKTTLWLDSVRRARQRGFTVLVARATMAESVLAYTVLADLLGHLDDTFWEDLPAAQRQGLDAVLLRGDWEVETDQRAVAAAFGTVLNRIVARGPVLVAIDDFQWLDTSSAKVMSFAARRLPQGAAIMCTTRTDEVASHLQLARPDAVRRIRLPALTVGELQQVLRVGLGSAVSRPTLFRVHEISGGNPFYALELAREIATRGSNHLVGLPSSVADLVRTRLERVGTGADDILLAVACLAEPTVPLIAQATATTPDRLVELLAEAETQGVVAIEGNRVRFTHPLLAHGVYSAAPARHRRGMHRRLAALFTEPELRARHLALSDPTGHKQTIDALDVAAEIAGARGAPAAAAELVELAIGLGADAPERHIRCAEFYFSAGDSQRARQVLESGIERLAPGDLRAEALSLLAVVRLYDDGFIEATGLLQGALDEVGDRLTLRVPVLVTLSYALFNAGRLAQAVPIADEAVSCAERLEQSQALSQALGMQVLMHFLSGDGLDEATMGRALDLADEQSYVPMPLRPRVQNALLLAFTGRLATARAQMLSIRRDAIEKGEEGELIFPAFHHFLVECWLGNMGEASVVAEDTLELALELGSELAHVAAMTARAWLAAYAGRESDSRRDVDAALAASQRSGTFRLTQWAITAVGFLEVSLGNYVAALEALEPVLSAFDARTDSTEIVAASFVPDAVEALIGLSRIQEAEPMIGALEDNGTRLDRAWMLAVGARCRAMVLAADGNLTAATAAVERAMAEHDRLTMPFERARTQLLLGQLQRRQRRRDTAAATLHDALQTFERLGTAVWAERCRAELSRATSGTRRAAGLTASERRVAELAASGMSNKEIASMLFVSPKTVEVNLSRTYRKLGLHSRVELYRKLASSTPVDSPEE